MPPDDVDEVVASYNTTLKATLDMHTPLKSKIIVGCPHAPWFNEEAKATKRKYRKAEKGGDT